MRKVRDCFITDDFDMFHYLVENRISTSDVEQAIRDGHDPARVKSFIRRKDKMKNELMKEGFSRIVAIPTYFKDGKYWLGDGATRVAALKELKAEGKLPKKHEVQFLVYTEEDMSLVEFITELELLNDFNGTKWDITDKITALARSDARYHKILDIARKYNIAVSACMDLTFGQGSTKETTDLTTRTIFNNVEALCEFIHNISLTYNMQEVKTSDFLNALRTIWMDAEKYDILDMFQNLLTECFGKEMIDKKYQIGKKMNISDWQFALVDAIMRLFNKKITLKGFGKKYTLDNLASFKRLKRDKWDNLTDEHMERWRDKSRKLVR